MLDHLSISQTIPYQLMSVSVVTVAQLIPTPFVLQINVGRRGRTEGISLSYLQDGVGLTIIHDGVGNK